MRKTIHYEYDIAYVQNVKSTILKETNAPSVKNSYKKRMIKMRIRKTKISFDVDDKPPKNLSSF